MESDRHTVRARLWQSLVRGLDPALTRHVGRDTYRAPLPGDLAGIGDDVNRLNGRKEWASGPSHTAVRPFGPLPAKLLVGDSPGGRCS